MAEPAPEPPQGGQQSSGANEDGALVPPEVGKSTRGGFAWGELARAQEEEKRGTPAVEMTQREPLRCGFGAVRVGALLGRLRLHLQTDRFLAVHRGDGVWESACVAAARTLAEIVETMSEAALDAPLAPDGTERGAR